MLRTLRGFVDKRRMRHAILPCLAGLLLVSHTRGLCAQETSASERAFERGYFLQSFRGDSKAAAEFFAKVAADEAAPADLRSEASRRLAECREDIFAGDLAALMPPKTAAYVELSQPGAHLKQLAKLAGLLDSPTGEGDIGKRIPIAPGVFLPRQIVVSPALLDAFANVQGIAVGLTGVDQRGRPQGLVALNFGKSKFVQGLVETFVQVLQPDAPIGNHPTFRIDQHAWVVSTARHLIVSTKREELEAAVQRLANNTSPRLSTQARFQVSRSQDAPSLLFAWVDGQIAAQHAMQHLRGEEAAIATGVFDLRHLDSVAIAAGVGDDGIHLQLQLRMADGHQNLAYGLIRTAPLSGKALSNIPDGAAAVALLGLNPVGGVNADGAPAPVIGLMDVGRELFGNLQEAAVFVLPEVQPTDGQGPPIPKAAVILTSTHGDRSEMLWQQLLVLPSIFGVLQAPVAIEVGGKKGQALQIPHGPTVALVRLDETTIGIGTIQALEASAAIGRTRKPVAEDPVIGTLADGLTKDSSKAVFVNIGRVMQLVSQFQRRGPSDEQRVISEMLSDLSFSLITDEAATPFIIRASLTGLPNVSRIVHQMAAMWQRDVQAIQRRRSRSASRPAGGAADVAAPVPARRVPGRAVPTAPVPTRPVPADRVPTRPAPTDRRQSPE